jgi:formylglycine-generating enzyme required for sulfatase activity
MDDNPSRFKGDGLPVETVSWDDTQVFIGALNRMKPELKLCLPTEAQWEYACRAGSTTPFCWGEQINSELVNFRGTAPYNTGQESEYRESTVDVKSFHQNNWGLWQMHGNVLEWCQDWYGEYKPEPPIDPEGPETGERRVLRGGSWGLDGWFCRSAYRGGGTPVNRGDYIGFRLALGHEKLPVAPD